MLVLHPNPALSFQCLFRKGRKGRRTRRHSLFFPSLGWGVCAGGIWPRLAPPSLPPSSLASRSLFILFRRTEQRHGFFLRAGGRTGGGRGSPVLLRSEGHRPLLWSLARRAFRRAPLEHPWVDNVRGPHSSCQKNGPSPVRITSRDVRGPFCFGSRVCRSPPDEPDRLCRRAATPVQRPPRVSPASIGVVLLRCPREVWIVRTVPPVEPLTGVWSRRKPGPPKPGGAAG